MKKNHFIPAVALSAVMALSISLPVSVAAETKTTETVSDASVDTSFLSQEVVESAELESEFLVTVDSPQENVSILTVSNANFEQINGDVVVVSEDGTIIENLSTTIDSTPGANIELLNDNQVRTTIDPNQYPELQLKCGVSALSGGTAGLVAGAVGLAAAGVTTGGAAFAVLALAGAAGYGTGAVQGGCFD